MIRTMLTAAASAFLAVGVFAAEPRTEVKLLTIGNSFADSAFRYLPRVAESAGCKIVMDRANIGGCRLSRHWKLVEDSERDPKVKPYSRGTANLREMLERQKWDFVTIQQASHDSWRPETFQPWAGNIIAYVKKHAPQAEVVIQQTWAYRADHPQFQPGGEWGISQREMYDRLTANYTALAKKLGLRVIPSGFAVQLSREQEPLPFENYDPALPEHLRWPDLPPQAGAIVGRCFWERDTAGHWQLRRDLIHLNCRGQYLQACVWFAFLFERPVEEIIWVPENLDVDDAAFLRNVAAAAVAGRESL